MQFAGASSAQLVTNTVSHTNESRDVEMHERTRVVVSIRADHSHGRCRHSRGQRHQSDATHRARGAATDHKAGSVRSAATDLPACSVSVSVYCLRQLHTHTQTSLVTSMCTSEPEFWSRSGRTIRTVDVGTPTVTSTSPE